MKYLVMVAATLMLSVGQGNGQMATSIDVVDVPKKVLATFNKNGKVEQVDWTLEKEQYIASFYDETKLVFLQLYYNEEGKWLKTQKELEEDKLPTPIATSLSEIYGENYAILLITEASYPDKVEYQVEIEYSEEMLQLLFDKNGKLLSKVALEEEIEIFEDED
ncbi:MULTISPECIES: PepSY-like domain-containing protein [unclassified Aureispira]|uniref:PepSY-like domain-containing protein n=1 Tax=unclassified Aureispira TaxID=2649989 RepID=UPI000697D09B|nr:MULTISPECIES: PepSY-like domain-containing protein [unclassified Aureispira]WMX16646.1 PepSY-like domain-containing protein [Aureispira sp. CCB-E]